MPSAIIDLLQSARLLAVANDEKVLCYLIDMALQEARETKSVPEADKKAA